MAHSLPDDGSWPREAQLVVAKNADDAWKELRASVADCEREAYLAQAGLNRARREAEADVAIRKLSEATANFIDAIGLRLVVRQDRSLLLQARFPFEVTDPVSEVKGTGVSMVTTPSTHPPTRRISLTGGTSPMPSARGEHRSGLPRLI